MVFWFPQKGIYELGFKKRANQLVLGFFSLVRGSSFVIMFSTESYRFCITPKTAMSHNYQVHLEQTDS